MKKCKLIVVYETRNNCDMVDVFHVICLSNYYKNKEELFSLSLVYKNINEAYYTFKSYLKQLNFKVTYNDIIWIND